MSIAPLISALCAGLNTATVWLALCGSVLSARLVYVLSGQLFMAGLMAHAAIRGFR